MQIIYVVMITMLVTLGVYEGMKWIYGYLRPKVLMIFQRVAFKRFRLKELEDRVELHSVNFHKLSDSVRLINSDVQANNKSYAVFSKAVSVFRTKINSFNYKVSQNTKKLSKIKIGQDGFEMQIKILNDRINALYKTKSCLIERVDKIERFVEANEDSIGKLWAEVKKDGTPENIVDLFKNLEKQNRLNIAQYVERIRIIEDRQKQYDTSLHTHGEMIDWIRGK